MKSKIIGLAVTLALFVGGPTQAAIVNVTFSGVAIGFDDAGFFGPASAFIADDYVANFSFDTSSGSSQQTAANLSASLTIAGQTVNVSGGFFSILEAIAGPQIGFSAKVQPSIDDVFFNSVFATNGIPFSIETPFYYALDVAGGDSSDGEFKYGGDDLLLVAGTVALAVPFAPAGAGLPGLIFAVGALLGWWHVKRRVSLNSMFRKRLPSDWAVQAFRY